MAEEAPLPSSVATSQPVESYEPPAKESLCDAEPVAEACAQLTQEFFKGDTLCCLITSLQQGKMLHSTAERGCANHGDSNSDISAGGLEETVV
ncbi:hypothetical protein Bca4012_089567 [Brassica carinata]|nr:unnamed protein product [Brassica oleracea]